MTSNVPTGASYPGSASEPPVAVPPPIGGVPDVAPAATTSPSDVGASSNHGAFEGSPLNGPGDGAGSGSSTTEVAKQQASEVAQDAGQSVSHVAGVAKDQAGEVLGEAKQQAQQMLHQARSEVMDQAGQQQQRAAEGLRTVADQLQAMADGSEQSGTVVNLARQAADKTHEFAGWLENRNPGAVLNEVRSFARRRPGVFLAIALGAGVVAGRLARGMTSDADQDQDTAGTDMGQTSTGAFAGNRSALTSGQDPFPADAGYGVGTQASAATLTSAGVAGDPYPATGVGTYPTADAYPVTPAVEPELSDTRGDRR